MHIAENTHWYTPDGQPCYEVASAKGSMRPTTLRDARKLGLVPSVTGIIKCAAAPALEVWKANQLMMSALTLPRLPQEPESAWLDRVKRDSREQGRKAAERGTAIHAAIQGHYEGKPPDEDYWAHVKGTAIAVDQWSTAHWRAEQSFAHRYGFGGKCDLSGTLGGIPFVVDFKTKEFGAEDDLKTWDEHAMQLAAYREGLDMPEARCAIVYVSASLPGLVRVLEIDTKELKQGWNMFLGLLAYWQAKTGYYPFEKVAA